MTIEGAMRILILRIDTLEHQNRTIMNALENRLRIANVYRKIDDNNRVVLQVIDTYETPKGVVIEVY